MAVQLPLNNYRPTSQICSVIKGKKHMELKSKKNKFDRIKNKGFSLIEMLLYVLILSLVSIMVVNTLILLASSFSTVKASKNIQISSSTILERMIMEIRNSNSVDLTSTLDSNPGILKLNAEDISGTPYTVEFYIEGGILKIKKDGGTGQPLSLSNTTIPNLVFRRIITGEGEAIKIELTLQTIEGNITNLQNFYATAILRGSYAN